MNNIFVVQAQQTAKDCGLSRIKSKSLWLSTTAVMAGALFVPSVAHAVDPSNSWNYDTVLGGSVAKDTSIAGVTDITVTGGNGFVEGNADIYTGHTVNVTGQSGKTFAYRDNRANIESTLNGNLNSNMKVVIIDKDGVFFTKSSKVDVQSLAVSSGDVQVSDIMDGGDLTFDNVGAGGEIVTNGSITVAEAGLAAFVSPMISNNGVIKAKMGNVAMAAGDAVTLDLYGDGLVEVAVSGTLADALVKNRGTIEAEGGNVQITAAAAKGALDNIVNNEGIITVASASVSGGKIIISGGDAGTVRNTGAIKTSGTGKVEVSGERFLQEFDFTPPPKPAHTGQPYIQANGGDVDITTTGNVEIASGYVDANGGDIVIKNDGVFHSVGANTIRTNGLGTIGLNQNVGGGAASIQNVIDAVQNTGAGVNTIAVGAGTYNEIVRVDHANIVLQGANAGLHGRSSSRGAETILVATPSIHHPAIGITADNAVIDGFEIVGGEAGVRVQNADNVIVKNNVIHGQYHISGEGNSFGAPAGGDGIYVGHAENTLLDSNFIYGMNDDGIQADYVTNLTVKKNVINDHGNGDQGIGINYASGITTVEDNTVTNARRDGIQLVNVTDTSNVLGNKIYHSKHSGISLNQVSGNSNLDNNFITYSQIGVDVVNSSNIIIGDRDANDDSGNTLDHNNIGVKLSASNRIFVQDNAITNARDGVLLQHANNTLIQYNEIGASQNGVRFQGGINAERAYVYGNDITAGRVGILVEGGITNGSLVNFGQKYGANKIVAGTDGIRVKGAIENSRLRISDSSIIGAEDGVEIESVGNGAVAAIWYNTNIVGQTGDGVKVGSVSSTSGDNGLAIVGNYNIEGAKDGIRIGNVDVASVALVDNDRITGGKNGIHFGGTITDTASSILMGDDGIDARDTVITGTTGHGIYFEKIVDNSAINIGAGNKDLSSDAFPLSGFHANATRGVVASGAIDGVRFGGVVTGNSHITLADSQINGANGDGARFRGLVSDSTASFDRNIINAFEDGIEFDGAVTGSLVAFRGNTISTDIDDGIDFSAGFSGSTITLGGFGVGDGNAIDAGDDGLVVNGVMENGSLNVIANTSIHGVSDGLDIHGLIASSANILVQGNHDIFGLIDDGVEVTNRGASLGGHVIVTDNIMNGVGSNGLELSNIQTVSAYDNTMANSASNGIYLNTIADADLNGNDVNNSARHGLYVSGVNNGAIALSGNIFTDNGLTGARFESGGINISALAHPNSFINATGLPATAMQFTLKTGGSGLRIVNETLGGTVFDGYLPANSFYARFENGSIMNGATPIIIDAANASFDGVVPSTFIGGLPPATLQFIEDRLFDADDAPLNGRGQIFVGAPAIASSFGINTFQDFIPLDQLQNGLVGGRASVTIRGLPFVDTAFLPNLNAITPAAGGNEGGEDSPSAATEGAVNEEDIANINPEAGGNNGTQAVTCVQDAVSSLSSNGSVTYNFGGSFEDSIAGESSCSAVGL